MLPAARPMHNLSEFCSRCGSTRADVEGCPVEGEIVGPPTTASLESCSSGAPARFTALEVAALVLLPCLSLALLAALCVLARLKRVPRPVVTSIATAVEPKPQPSSVQARAQA